MINRFNSQCAECHDLEGCLERIMAKLDGEDVLVAQQHVVGLFTEDHMQHVFPFLREAIDGRVTDGSENFIGVKTTCDQLFALGTVIDDVMNFERASDDDRERFLTAFEPFLGDEVMFESLHDFFDTHCEVMAEYLVGRIEQLDEAGAIDSEVAKANLNFLRRKMSWLAFTAKVNPTLRQYPMTFEFVEAPEDLQQMYIGATLDYLQTQQRLGVDLDGLIGWFKRLINKFEGFEAKALPRMVEITELSELHTFLVSKARIDELIEQIQPRFTFLIETGNGNDQAGSELVGLFCDLMIACPNDEQRQGYLDQLLTEDMKKRAEPIIGRFRELASNGVANAPIFQTCVTYVDGKLEEERQREEESRIAKANRAEVEDFLTTDYSTEALLAMVNDSPTKAIHLAELTFRAEKTEDFDTVMGRMEVLAQEDEEYAKVYEAAKLASSGGNGIGGLLAALLGGDGGLGGMMLELGPDGVHMMDL
jgi:hypothetical protein